MKSVYLLLSRSSTCFSRLVHLVTRDEFTHISLSLDRELAQVYSFARRTPYFYFPAGLVEERLDRGIYLKNSDAPCALYELPLPEEVFSRVETRLVEMLSHAEDYRYSVLGLVFLELDIAHERARHYFCSQFVGSLLQESGALALPKPPSLMRPNDFQILPELKLLYRGPLSQCVKVQSPAGGLRPHPGLA